MIYHSQAVTRRDGDRGRGRGGGSFTGGGIPIKRGIARGPGFGTRTVIRKGASEGHPSQLGLRPWPPCCRPAGPAAPGAALTESSDAAPATGIMI